MSTDPLLIASTLATRMRVRQRDRWNRSRLLAVQSMALERLLRHARTNSPYYRDVLSGTRAPHWSDCRSSRNRR